MIPSNQLCITPSGRSMTGSRYLRRVNSDQRTPVSFRIMSLLFRLTAAFDFDAAVTTPSLVQSLLMSILSMCSDQAQHHKQYKVAE